MKLTETEQKYIAARCIHSHTAQECWRLRAQLDRDGLTPKREMQLNQEFGRWMSKGEAR